MSSGSHSALGVYIESVYLAVPGHSIWTCPAVYRKLGLAKSIEAGLTQIPGISACRVNYWTGRISVTHDAQFGPNLLVRLVDDVVRVCVESHADDYPADERDPTGSALRLGRELVEQLVLETRALRAAEEESSEDRSPEDQPGAGQPRGVGALFRNTLLRRVRSAGGASVVRGAASVLRGGVLAREKGLPSLDPVVVGLTRWLAESYGGRLTEQSAAPEPSPHGPVSRVVGRLFGDQRVGGPPQRPRRGFVGGVIDRLEELAAASTSPDGRQEEA